MQFLHSWDVERRHDGAVLVRVHSRNVNGRALPDAVFAFRAGDPQFAFWDEQLKHRDTALSPGNRMPSPGDAGAPPSMPMSQTG